MASSPNRRRSFRWVRHPLRALALSLAAVVLSFGITGLPGVLAAVAGVAGGIALGEVLGRSRVRLLGIAIALLLGLALSWWLARFATASPLLPGLIGPVTALTLGAVVRFFCLSLFAVTALRTLAVRRPSLMALELAAVAGALALFLASHRHGVIARPLWLSDWAWQSGIDPTHVFLVVGAAVVIGLAVIMVAETGRRLTAASVVALPALALLVVIVLDVTGLPTPIPANALGLTEAEGEAGEQGGEAGQDGQPLEEGQRGDRPVTLTPAGSGQGVQASGAVQPELDLDRPPPQDSDPAPMAVVLLGDDYSPPSQMYYFRQNVWSEFNGSRLVPEAVGWANRDLLQRFPVGQVAVSDPPTGEGRTLVHADVALLVRHNQPFALETPTRFVSMPNPDPGRFVRAYRFEALAQSGDYSALIGRRAGDPSWSEETWRHFLALPDDERYRDLAAEIVGELPPDARNDPFLQALAVKLTLDRELIYSTRHRHAGVADPTADFLFGNRTGYCVHFAHAAVYLWRALGIPARIGVGYGVPVDNRVGSTIVILSADSHSWPELYLEGVGWVVLDIAAERSLDPPVPTPDEELARLLGEMARDEPPDPQETLQTAGVGDDAPYLQWVVLMAIALALAGLYGVKIWRRAAPRWAGSTDLPRVGYRAALDLLGEVGLCRQWGETRERFATRVGRQLPAFHPITDMHVAARFGDPARPVEARPEYAGERWRDLLRDLKGQIPNVATRFKRALGRLNPVSFFLSR